MCVSQRAFMSPGFFFSTLLLYTCVRSSVRACRGGYAAMFDILGSVFGVFDSRRHFPSYSYSLFSLLGVGLTVIIRVYTSILIWVPKYVWV